MIFCIFIANDWVARPNLAANSGVLALISNPKSFKALISIVESSWNWIGYQMQGIRYKASGLAITSMDITKTIASFLTYFLEVQSSY